MDGEGPGKVSESEPVTLKCEPSVREPPLAKLIRASSGARQVARMDGCRLRALPVRGGSEPYLLKWGRNNRLLEYGAKTVQKNPRVQHDGGRGVEPQRLKLWFKLP